MTSLQKQLKDLAAFRKMLRDFFDSRGFAEVQTPVLVKTPGIEKHLEYFQTKWKHPVFGEHDLALRSSPEIVHKYLLSQGAEAIYEIGPCMRQGEEIGPWHNPEFTMLEFYKTGWKYEPFLKTCTELVDQCLEAGSSPESTKPWKRITIKEAFENFAGVELEDEDSSLAAKAQRAGVVSVRKDDSFEDAFFKTLIEKVEPAIERLGKVVLEKYPLSQAALSKRVGNGPSGYAARFELFIGGIELGNCFLEEHEAQHIQARIEEVRTYRGENTSEDLVLSHLCLTGIPASCGAAFGVERLFAAARGHKSIKQKPDYGYYNQSQPRT